MIGTGLLIENCVGITVYTKEGHLLHLAAREGAIWIKKFNQTLFVIKEFYHSGHVGVARILIENGADVNAANNEYEMNRTPLHLAVAGNCPITSVLD